jgi:3-hydroxypropanoate dehydrogenase
MGAGMDSLQCNNSGVAMTKVSAEALSQLFFEARTHNGFTNREVPEELLHEAVKITEMGPTSVNMSPLRIVFIRSAAAKERLKPTLSPGNLDKTMAAPVVALTAYDPKFYEHLPFLFPHAVTKPWFDSNEAFATLSAFRNGTLQVGYLILALRAVGLDTGPMSGFDNAKVDAEFFADSGFKSNVLINIGYGDTSKLFPRSPRFAFEQVATII